MANMARSSNPVLAADSDIQLHVEGITDEEVIKERWLRDHPDLRRAFSDFKSFSADSKSPDKKTSGCAALVERLAGSLNLTDVIAMGLADRDLLRTKSAIDIFLEPDDVKFRTRATQFLTALGIEAHGVDELGDRLWVLHRWEIENYLLLDLDLIADAYKNNAHKSPVGGPTGSSVEAISEALTMLADEAVPLVAAEAAQVRRGAPIKNWPEKYEALGRKAMHITVTHNYRELTEEEVSAEIQRIEAFGDNCPVGSPQHWDRLSRIVDGKWIFSRISNRWLKWDTQQIRRNLASNQALKMKGPPGEIVDVLTEMRDRAKEIGRKRLPTMPKGMPSAHSS